MGVAITKTSKETCSYYGPSLALLHLRLPPPLPYFRRPGHRRPQLYADAYNSALLGTSCPPPALSHYLPYSPLPPTSPSAHACMHVCVILHFLFLRRAGVAKAKGRTRTRQATIAAAVKENQGRRDASHRESGGRSSPRG